MKFNTFIFIASLTVCLSGCVLLRPIVIEPNITVVVNDDDQDGQLLANNTVNLPVCYLERCKNLSDNDCASRALRLLTNKNSDVWQMVESKPKALVKFAPRGYYISAKNRVTREALEGRWFELGCVSDPNSEIDSASSARSRECNRRMSRWVRIANQESILKLERDAEFRRTCQRETVE